MEAMSDQSGNSPLDATQQILAAYGAVITILLDVLVEKNAIGLAEIQQRSTRFWMMRRRFTHMGHWPSDRNFRLWRQMYCCARCRHQEPWLSNSARSRPKWLRSARAHIWGLRAFRQQQRVFWTEAAHRGGAPREVSVTAAPWQRVFC